MFFIRLLRIKTLFYVRMHSIWCFTELNDVVSQVFRKFISIKKPCHDLLEYNFFLEKYKHLTFVCHSKKLVTDNSRSCAPEFSSCLSPFSKRLDVSPDAAFPWLPTSFRSFIIFTRQLSAIDTQSESTNYKTRTMAFETICCPVLYSSAILRVYKSPPEKNDSNSISASIFPIFWPQKKIAKKLLFQCIIFFEIIFKITFFGWIKIKINNILCLYGMYT